ncbi:MAG: hypothetical protein ABI821_03575 [Pseudomonadota bacterium]
MKWIVIILVLIVAAAVGSYWYDGYSARSALLKLPVYHVIRKHEPQLFDKVVEEYKVFERNESRREDFVNFANYEVSLAATQHLAHASQESVLALVRDMVGTARTLEKQPGDTCFRYWFPLVSGPPDVARFIDAKSQAHTMELMGEVIRSAAENPVPLPDAGNVKENLTNVINSTYEQYGPDAQMMSHVSDERVDRAKVCTITISVYDRILELPPKQATDLIRAMTQVKN